KSNFFIDIDKEGQFKINIPASSEIGNVSLNTRYENYSSILSKTDPLVSPNQFVKNTENIDIYLTDFSGKPSISLNSSGDILDGYQSPIDYKTEEPIKYGTAFHDILNTCSEFQNEERALYLKAGMKLINFDPTNR